MNTVLKQTQFIEQNKTVRMRTAIGQKSTTTEKMPIERNGKT